MSGMTTAALLATVLAAVATAVGFAVRTTALPTGPAELVWDKTACAHCSMHVGEPEFAAQLQTQDGRTLAFDDPGCLFLLLDAERPPVHAIWFRHCREARWLPAAAVAFVELTPTPMGFGLGAVDAGTPGSLAFAVAAARCRRPAAAGDRR